MVTVQHKWDEGMTPIRIFVIMMALCVAVLTMPLRALADPGSSTTSTHLGDSNTDGFYKVASAAAVYTDIIATWTDDSTYIDNMGNAASGLGFIDKDYALQGVNYTLSSNNSQNAAYYSLSAVSRVPHGADYAKFGYAAQRMGLDSTSVSFSSAGMGGVVRAVLGGILQGAYWLAAGLGSLMNFFVKLMQQLNPFGLLYGFVMDPETNGGIVPFASDVDMTSDGNNWLVNDQGTIASMVTSFLSGVYGFATRWMVPLFFIVAIFGALWAAKDGQRLASQGGRIKNAFIRAVFVVAGVALVGSLYTGVLNQLAAGIGNGTGFTYGADRAVLMTLVDTESWAENRFDQEGATITCNDAGENGIEVSDESVSAMRATAAKINLGSEAGQQLTETTGVLNSTNSLINVNSIVTPNEGDADDDEAAQDQRADSVTDVMHTKAESLISRYLKGDMINITGAGDAAAGQSKSADIAKFLMIASDPENYAKNLAGVASASNDGSAYDGSTPKFLTTAVRSVSGAATRTATAEQNLYSLIQSDPAILDNHNAVANMKALVESPGGGSAGIEASTNYLSDGTDTQLSTIGTYNYLNTEFGKDGFTVYSPKQSTNNATRCSHYSVSCVGLGPLGQVLTLLDLILSMSALVIITLVYGLGMVFNNLRRGFSIIGHLPFAMLGAMRSIAQVLMLGFMMAIEAIASILLYSVAIELVLGANNFVVGGLPGVGITNPVVGTLLGILIVLMSIIVALRMRGLFIQASGDMTSKVLESFLLGQKPTSQIVDTQSNIGKQLVNGAATGIGMSMMSGGMGGAAKGAAIAGGGALALGALAGTQAMNTDQAAASVDAINNALEGQAELPGGTSVQATNMGSELQASMMGADATSSAGTQSASFMNFDASERFGSSRDETLQPYGSSDSLRASLAASAQGGTGASGDASATGYGAGGQGVGAGATADSSSSFSAAQGANASASGLAGGQSSAFAASGDSSSTGYGTGFGSSTSTTGAASAAGNAGSASPLDAHSVRAASANVSASASGASSFANSMPNGRGLHSSREGMAGAAGATASAQTMSAQTLAASLHGVLAAPGNATASAAGMGQMAGVAGANAVSVSGFGSSSATGMGTSAASGGDAINNASLNAHSVAAEKASHDTSVAGRGESPTVVSADYNGMHSVSAMAGDVATSSEGGKSEMAGRLSGSVSGSISGKAAGMYGVHGVGDSIRGLKGAAGANAAGTQAAGSSAGAASISHGRAGATTADGSRIHNVRGSASTSAASGLAAAPDGTSRGSGIEGKRKGIHAQNASAAARHAEAVERARKSRAAHAMKGTGTGNHPSVSADSVSHATRTVQAMPTQERNSNRRA